MVDSNLQREEILPSEKAFSYKMKYDAMKRQGKRSDLTSAQNGPKMRSDDQLAQQVWESRNSLKRYTRLTELIPRLLDLVDHKRISLMVAVEMSFFTRKIQGWFYDYCLDVRVPKWDDLSNLRSGTP